MTYLLTLIGDSGARTTALSEITADGVCAAAVSLGVSVTDPEHITYDLAAAYLTSGRVEGSVTTDHGVWIVRRG